MLYLLFNKLIETGCKVVNTSVIESVIIIKAFILDRLKPV